MEFSHAYNVLHGLEEGTLLIRVARNYRRIVKVQLDKERKRLTMLDKLHSEASRPITIPFTDISSACHGAQRNLPPELNIDVSVQSYWFFFTRASAVGRAAAETMHFLAFVPEIAQAWAAALSAESTDPSPGGDINNLTPSAGLLEPQINVDVAPVGTRRMTDGDPDYDSGMESEPTLQDTLSGELYYWVDWPFMIKLTHAILWTSALHTRLASRITEIIKIEQAIQPLECEEQVLWEAYHDPDPAQDDDNGDLDQDDLLQYYEYRVASQKANEEERKALGILSQLQKHRFQKAKALDQFQRVANKRQGSRQPSEVVASALDTVNSRFWAIVIGIDSYSDGQHLDGCVNDATLMVDFLRTDLRVPKSNICALTSSVTDTLRDNVGRSGSPTRAAILDALYKHFRDNTSIQRGDNLLFHFSGHGSSYDAPGNYQGHSRIIEALCPMDRNSTAVPPIHDISDRELNIAFSEIRNSKGPNVTVIFDCCHASSIVRGISSNTQRANVRAAPRLQHEDAVKRMLKDAELDNRRQSGSPSPLSPLWKGDMTSHVLLAACRSHETAKEVQYWGKYGMHGAFTFALVSALRSPRGVDPEMTYFKLCKSVVQPPAMQTIVVAGARKRSKLWFRGEST